VYLSYDVVSKYRLPKYRKPSLFVGGYIHLLHALIHQLEWCHDSLHLVVKFWALIQEIIGFPDPVFICYEMICGHNGILTTVLIPVSNLFNTSVVPNRHNYPFIFIFRFYISMYITLSTHN